MIFNKFEVCEFTVKDADRTKENNIVGHEMFYSPNCISFTICLTVRP